MPMPEISLGTLFGYTIIVLVGLIVLGLLLWVLLIVTRHILNELHRMGFFSGGVVYMQQETMVKTPHMEEEVPPIYNDGYKASLKD